MISDGLLTCVRAKAAVNAPQSRRYARFAGLAPTRHASGLRWLQHRFRTGCDLPLAADLARERGDKR
jgi:hypothetical protein